MFDLQNLEAMRTELLTADVKKNIYVGEYAIFKKVLKDAGVLDTEKQISSLLGVDVRTDMRIPDGVWCLVPYGKNITDEGVHVGALSPEYRQAADSFANVLAYVRSGGYPLGSVFKV